MPSFLSKVFGRKKGDDKETEPTTPSPLGGKFEAVRLTPSVANFGERRSSGRAVGEGPRKSTDVAPHLSLNLPGVKDEGHRALGLLFPGEGLQTLLSDSAIGERRLSPSEAQLLVQACSEVIVSRGLETLGLMHPHWHSASPDVQRKLISLFLNSLAAKSALTTLSTSPLSEFESELGFTRTPQDVAAVLRWGLRHLGLEGSQLGKNPTWYRDFYQAEASANYPPKAYTTILSPLIHPSHLQLLSSILNLVTYIAAHSEANGISGSKLSKFIGLWLLTNERERSSDDWKAFYTRWETAGRQLEHIFLSQIRDEASNHPVPTRLSELVQQYPYSAAADSDLLPRPRFTTRCHGALLLRIQTTLPGFKSSRSSPLQLISEALKAQSSAQSVSQPHQIWLQIRAAAGEGEFDILSDESIRILSISASPDRPLSPTFRELNRRPSFSATNAGRGSSPFAASHTTNRHPRTSSSSEDSHQPPTASSYSFIGTADWAQFSQSGFHDLPSLGTKLASTLMDKDVEVTEPPPVSMKRSISRRSTASTIRNRKSMDTPPVSSIPASIINAEKEEQSNPSSTITEASIVELDEAFVDFWYDALGDPVASSWPNFVLARLKQSVASQLNVDGKVVEWVIVEQAFTKPPPPPTPAPLMIPSVSQQTAASTTSSPASRRPAPSPKPSQRSDTSKKRFSFFATRTSSDRSGKPKKGAKSPVIGEMGEIIPDVPSSAPRDTKLSTVGENTTSSAVAGTVGLISGGAVVAAGTAASLENKPTPSEPAPAVSAPTPEQAVQSADKESKVDEAESSEDSVLVVPRTTSQPEITVEKPTISVDDPTSLELTESSGIRSVPATETFKSVDTPITVPESPVALSEQPEIEESGVSTSVERPLTPPSEPSTTTQGTQIVQQPESAIIREPSAEASASVDQEQDKTRPVAEQAAVEHAEVVTSQPESFTPADDPPALLQEDAVSTPAQSHESIPEAKVDGRSVIAAQADLAATLPPLEIVSGLDSSADESALEPKIPTQESTPVERDDPVTAESQTILEPKLEQISPQIQPLDISPSTGDNVVALPEVPVVQAEIETSPLAIPIEAVSEPAPTSETVLSNATNIEEPSAPSAVQLIISSGETPGPQIMLDAAEPEFKGLVECVDAGRLNEPDEEVALPITPQIVEEEDMAPLIFTSVPVDDGSPSKLDVHLSPVEFKAVDDSTANTNKRE